MSVKRKFDLLDRETWHSPKPCKIKMKIKREGGRGGSLVSDCSLYARRLTRTVLPRRFGAGYEAVKCGRERGRNVDQRCACVYCLRKKKKRIEGACISRAPHAH